MTPASAPCRRRGERRRGRPPARVRRRARRCRGCRRGTTSEPRSLPVRASSTISSSPCLRTSPSRKGLRPCGLAITDTRPPAVDISGRSPANPRDQSFRPVAGSSAVSWLPARRTRTRSPPTVTGGIPDTWARLTRRARPVRRSKVSTRATEATYARVVSPTIGPQPVRADVRSPVRVTMSTRHSRSESFVWSRARPGAAESRPSVRARASTRPSRGSSAVTRSLSAPTPETTATSGSSTGTALWSAGSWRESSM